MLHSVLADARVPALAASLQAGALGLLVAVPARQLEDPVLERLCGQLAEQTSVDWAVGVGRGRPDLLAAAAGLDEAAHVAESAAGLGSAPGSAAGGSTDRPMSGCADCSLCCATTRGRRLRGRRTRPHQPGRRSPGPAPALPGIRGNKAQLARNGYLSRPTLYAKLARLQEKLGVTLDDAESRTSLHVALLLRGCAADRPSGPGPPQNPDRTNYGTFPSHRSQPADMVEA